MPSCRHPLADCQFVCIPWIEKHSWARNSRTERGLLEDCRKLPHMEDEVTDTSMETRQGIDARRHFWIFLMRCWSAGAFRRRQFGVWRTYHVTAHCKHASYAPNHPPTQNSCRSGRYSRWSSLQQIYGWPSPQVSRTAWGSAQRLCWTFWAIVLCRLCQVSVYSRENGEEWRPHFVTLHGALQMRILADLADACCSLDHC